MQGFASTNNMKHPYQKWFAKWSKWVENGKLGQLTQNDMFSWKVELYRQYKALALIHNPNVVPKWDKITFKVTPLKFSKKKGG